MMHWHSFMENTLKVWDEAKKLKKKLRRQVHEWAPKLSMRPTNCSNALQYGFKVIYSKYPEYTLSFGIHITQWTIGKYY